MAYQHDTFDRRIQLGASRRRREDAQALHEVGRWAGAIYLAGYAIECSLKALICFQERKDNLKDTQLYKAVTMGNELHSLIRLLEAMPGFRNTIKLDRTGKYKNAWNTIVHEWQKDKLRYWDKMGDRETSEHFLAAVKVIHDYILRQQGEAS